MNVIKNRFALGGVILLISFAGGLQLIASQYTSDSPNDHFFVGYNSRDRNTRSLYDLFYGMDQDSEGKYCCEALDSVENLLHQEYLATWKNISDSTCFTVSLGVYLDQYFPSDVVQRTMLEKVDSVLTDGFAYDLSEDAKISLKARGIAIPDSSILFLNAWHDNFERITEDYNSITANVKNGYTHILGSRGSVVCHIIYEDPSCVTYILESSVDYHGSSGCPSKADYYTLNKDTGKILSQSDIIKLPEIKNISDQVASEYIKAAKEKGFDPTAQLNGDDLLRKADGIALTNEGLLIYFHPYTIGCGAEGQYNLLVPLND